MIPILPLFNAVRRSAALSIIAATEWRAEMHRIGTSKLRKLAAHPYPWVVRRFKDKIVIEIARTRIPNKRKPQATIAPDCRPEIW